MYVMGGDKFFYAQNHRKFCFHCGLNYTFMHVMGLKYKIFGKRVVQKTELKQKMFETLKH